jgi:ribosomal protein S18 acetylase RimI-like enzyme
MGDGPHPAMMPLATCDLSLDRLLDDYTRQQNLPRDALDSLKAALGTGRLEGWVAVEAGRAVGLVAFKLRDTWGQISLVHAPGRPGPVRALVAQALADLRQREGLTSIVASGPLPAGSVREAFLDEGFMEIERQEMSLDLAHPPPNVPPPLGYQLVSWHPRYRDAVAEVMWQANHGLPDALIYPALQTVEGCRDLVAKIATGRWGRFLAGASPVALDADGIVVGLLLAGRIARGTGYVLEVAVLPEHQGAGLGKALVALCLARCQATGLSKASLAVSRHNAPAMGLYHKLGFEEETRFSAFVWRQEVLPAEA